MAETCELTTGADRELSGADAPLKAAGIGAAVTAASKQALPAAHGSAEKIFRMRMILPWATTSSRILP